jgi:hypothetical protein
MDLVDIVLAGVVVGTLLESRSLFDGVIPRSIPKVGNNGKNRLTLKLATGRGAEGRRLREDLR